MEKTVKFVLPSIILILLFALIFIPGKNKNIADAPLSPTPTEEVAPNFANVTPIAAEDSKCHALLLDPSDSQSYLPDKDCTPGVIDPSVTQENLFLTICKSGYTKTVRPPASYTNKLKKQQIVEYGYFDTSLGSYEEDHLISLELGGSPDDPKNLWPEPHPSYNEKDSVENYLHSQVCSGKMTLSEVQTAISTNWYEVYKQMIK